MPNTLFARTRPVLLLLAPLLAILAGRTATHSDLASRHPRTAFLLFLWIAADSLALALIAKAPGNRPGLRALLGAVAAGCIVATLGAAEPVRAALFEMRAVMLAMALTIASYLVWSLFGAALRYARTRSLAEAAGEILPAPMVRFASFELAMMQSALFGWRREPEIPAGSVGFSGHRIENQMIGALLGLQVVEIGVVHLMVSHWSPLIASILLALGIWGILFTLALMNELRCHPVLLSRDTIRVRHGPLAEFTVRLSDICALESAISHEETKRRDVLRATALTHPNVVLRLARPLEYRGLLGRVRRIERVAFRLDEPAPFLAALSERI